MQSTKTDEENSSLQPVFLSDVELYYSEKVRGKQIEITGEECHHIKDVMRHKVDDEIYVTDGLGTIYHSKILGISKNKIECQSFSSTQYENKLGKVTFCVPRMKSSDRFEFALEKSVELGITNFIVFESKRTIAKGEKIDRWQKVLTSAMKQSLRSWLPKISYAKSIGEIIKQNGTKILFDQNSDKTFQSILNSQLTIGNCFFIFGPEGGFEKGELRIDPLRLTSCEARNGACADEGGELQIRLTENRLRSETAIVTAASMLAMNV